MNKTSNKFFPDSPDTLSTEEKLPQKLVHRISKDMSTSTMPDNAKPSHACFLVQGWMWLTEQLRKTVFIAPKKTTSSNSEICQSNGQKPECVEEWPTRPDTPTPWNSPERETWIPLENPIHKCSSYMAQDSSPCTHPKLVRSRATYTTNGGSALPVQGSLGYYGNYIQSISPKH